MDIGDLANDQVQLWATRDGITVNPSIRDRTGWDLRFEIRRDGVKTEPLDLLPADVVCDVQVKGTRTKGNRLAIKLSNWERHVKSPTPFFFVIVVYDDTASASQTYLVHVGEHWISRTLRRLRQEYQKGTSPEQLHKKTLGVTWTEADRIEPSRLREAILNYIGDLSEYTKRKLEWLDTSGYESGRVRGTLTFGPEVSQADLAELAIGNRKTLPLRSLRLDDMRFDVPSSLPMPEEPCEIKIPNLPSLGDTLVRVVNTKTGRDASFLTKTLASHTVFPFLPKRLWMCRCFNDYISLIFSFDQDPVELEYTPGDFDVPVDLAVGARVARFIEIVATGRQGSVEIEFTFPTGASTTARPSTVRVGPEALEYATMLDRSWTLARSAGVVDGAQAIPGDLRRSLTSIATLEAASECATGTAEFKPSAPKQIKERGVCLITPSFNLVDSIVSGLVVIDGNVHLSGKGEDWISISGPMQMRGVWSTPRDGWIAWKEGTLRQIVRRTIDEYETKGVEVFCDEGYV